MIESTNLRGGFVLALAVAFVPACSERGERPMSAFVTAEKCQSVCPAGVATYEYKADPLQTRCECSPSKVASSPCKDEPAHLEAASAPDAGGLFWCESDDAGVFWCESMRGHSGGMMACVSPPQTGGSR